MTARFEMNRRGVLGLGVGALAVGLGPLKVQAAEEANLRAFWWGSPDRAKRTQAVIELFQKRFPGIALAGESAGKGFDQMLATQMAAGNAPDIFQATQSDMLGLSARGEVLELDKYVSKSLNLDAFGPDMVKLGTIAGKVMGVGLGLNAYCMQYDIDAFRAVGLQPPSEKITWAEYADLAVEFTKASKKPNYWMSCYGSAYYYALDVWLEQRGKHFSTLEGKLGFDVDDMGEFLEYWEALRRRNGCVPAEIQTLDNEMPENSVISQGKAAVTIGYSNLLTSLQTVNKQPMGITMLPVASKGSLTGIYFRPGTLWCVSSKSKTPDAAVEFVNFFVNNVEAAKVLGVERGAPMSAAMREAVLPTLEGSQKLSGEYMAYIADKVVPFPPPLTGHLNDFRETVYSRTVEELYFGKLTVSQAAKQIIDEGTRAVQ